MLANAGFWRATASGTQYRHSETPSRDRTVSRGGKYSYSGYSGVFRNGGCVAGILRFHHLWIRGSWRIPQDILPQSSASASFGVLLFSIRKRISSTTHRRIPLWPLRRSHRAEDRFSHEHSYCWDEYMCNWTIAWLRQAR